MNSLKLTKRSLTPQQVEEVYGIPVGTLANQRYLKKSCKYHRLGRRILYFVEDIEDWIRNHAQPIHTVDSIPDEKKRC